MPSSIRARLRSTARAGLDSTARTRLGSTLTAVLVSTALLGLPGTAHAQPADGPAESARSGASSASSAATAPTGFEQQVLFKASQDPGYACYRIPAVVKTTQGHAARVRRGAGERLQRRRRHRHRASSGPPTAAAPGARSRSSTRARATRTATPPRSWTARPAASCWRRRTTRAVRTAATATCRATAPRTCSTATTTAAPGREPRDLSDEILPDALELLVRDRSRARHPADPGQAPRAGWSSASTPRRGTAVG